MHKTDLWSSKTEGTNKQYQEWKGAYRFGRGFKNHKRTLQIYAPKFEVTDKMENFLESITTKTDLKKKQIPYTLQKLNQ